MICYTCYTICDYVNDIWLLLMMLPDPPGSPRLLTGSCTFPRKSFQGLEHIYIYI